MNATQITGERQRAEHNAQQQCGLRAAAMTLRLINEGWTLSGDAHGYTLTPPATAKEHTNA